MKGQILYIFLTNYNSYCKYISLAAINKVIYIIISSESYCFWCCIKTTVLCQLLPSHPRGCSDLSGIFRCARDVSKNYHRSHHYTASSRAFTHSEIYLNHLDLTSLCFPESQPLLKIFQAV